MTKKTKRGTSKTSKNRKKEFEIVEVFRDKMARSLSRNLAQTQEDAKRWHNTTGQTELQALASRITVALFGNGKELR